MAASGKIAKDTMIATVKGLGRMWGSDAIGHLAQALLDDPAPIVWRQAVLELALESD